MPYFIFSSDILSPFLVIGNFSNHMEPLQRCAFPQAWRGHQRALVYIAGLRDAMSGIGMSVMRVALTYVLMTCSCHRNG